MMKQIVKLFKTDENYVISKYYLEITSENVDVCDIPDSWCYCCVADIEAAYGDIDAFDENAHNELFDNFSGRSLDSIIDYYKSSGCNVRILDSNEGEDCAYVFVDGECEDID